MPHVGVDSASAGALRIPQPRSAHSIRSSSVSPSRLLVPHPRVPDLYTLTVVSLPHITVTHTFVYFRLHLVAIDTTITSPTVAFPY